MTSPFRIRARTAALVVGLAGLPAACGDAGPPRWQGYVEGEYVHIAAPFAGRLEQLAVRRGQQVETGTPLFALETDEEAAARERARAELRAAQARLADLQTGQRPPEVAARAAALARAQAEEERSRAALARDEAQYRIGGIAQAQLEQSRADARAAQARVRELLNELAVARLPGREAQQGTLAAEVDAARAALAETDWRLGRKAATAPQPALVQDTLFRLGEWVPAGSPVVRLLPPGNIKVRFFVPEAVLGGLRQGQRLQLRCDGCAAPVSATISYIAPEAEYTPPVIYSNETRDKLVFMVEAIPAAAEATRLHPGQPVTVQRVDAADTAAASDAEPRR